MYSGLTATELYNARQRTGTTSQHRRDLGSAATQEDTNDAQTMEGVSTPNMGGIGRTATQDDLNASQTSSTMVEGSFEPQDLVKYEPVELDADKQGFLGEVMKKTAVASREAMRAGVQLASAMTTLEIAREALVKTNRGAASANLAAGKEKMRREFITRSVEDEVNSLFGGHVLNLERSGMGGVGDVERTLVNEIARLKEVEYMLRSKNKNAIDALAEKNNEIQDWVAEYGGKAEELRIQLKRGIAANKGFWAEQFPAVKLPEAMADMDRAVEVLQWITKPGGRIQRTPRKAGKQDPR